MKNRRTEKILRSIAEIVSLSLSGILLAARYDLWERGPFEAVVIAGLIGMAALVWHITGYMDGYDDERDSI